MEGTRLDHIHIDIRDGVVVAIRGLVGGREYSLNSIRQTSYEKIPAPIFPLPFFILGLVIIFLISLAQMPENYTLSLSTPPPQWETITLLLVATVWTAINRKPTFRINLELASGDRFFYVSQDRAAFRRVASALMGALD